MKKPSPKLPKGVPQEFVDGLNTMTTDQLKALIVILQVQNQENEAFKESPEFTAAQEEYDYAKERYQLVVGPFKDTSTSLKNKTKAVVTRLKDKGGC